MNLLLIILLSALSLIHAGGPYGVPNCTERYITQYIDHFDWTIPKGTNGTYQMRYFTFDGFVKGNPTVVFFYCGNEDAVDLYVNNTGLMWELGQTMNAYLVFAEHRYYGKSTIYPPGTPDCMRYLTTEQAMADYAYLIRSLRTSLPSGEDLPFIGFGGSYGGMLGSWFRMRYPDALDGVIAASAPIWSFLGLDPPYDSSSFYEITTADATSAGGATDYCASNVANAWPRIANLSTTPQGLSLLSSTFLTCQPLKTEADGWALMYWAQNPWALFAEGDYPYPSDYLTHGDGYPMTAWPMRAACKSLNFEINDDTTLMTGIRQAVAVYYNRSTLNVPCFFNGEGEKMSPMPFPKGKIPIGPIRQRSANFASDCTGDWDYQWCTEMVQPFSSGMGNDMFYPPSPFDLNSSSNSCEMQWGVRPRPDWDTVGFPGNRLQDFSNIVFSNGILDPWHGGGVLQNISESIVAILIPNGAHHLDLMWSNSADPSDVIFARQFEANYIQKWINEKQQKMAKQ